ncbi:protein GVQW3-like [Belonocnema kinseyi]|uniref:protein GVQW3-like n=1 Tax=Belonocnema kinseyi TaxID=2817044 RepID=UPI00143DD070|nr:protein GVQW3-like [Belonocnema kinseyi]
MEGSIEQRYAIKFCVRLGKNATETYSMLREAFKDDCISRSQSGRWYKAFSVGRTKVVDEQRSGRPTTARTDANVERVQKLLDIDRRLGIRQIADTLDISTFAVHGIITQDLAMRMVCAKLVQKVLTQEQKDLRVLRCQELSELIESDPDLMNTVVTGDESWMFEYDPETKRQSSEWHNQTSPRQKKARMSKNRIKAMLIVFFNVRSVVHFEFIPEGTTVTAKVYLEVLKRLKRRVARVRPDIKDNLRLHHDNAPSHTAFLVTDYLARCQTPVVPHIFLIDKEFSFKFLNMYQIS